MSKLFKSQMHQRPTYETLVRDAISKPKDTISLPDGPTTILRKKTDNSQGMTNVRYYIWKRINRKIAKKQAQQAEIGSVTGADPGGSIAEEKGIQTRQTRQT